MADSPCKSSPEKTSLCLSNLHEIDRLREKSHNHGNKITMLMAQQEDDKERVKGVEEKITNLRDNHVGTMENKVSELKTEVKNISDKIKSIDTKFWAILILVITTLLSIVSSST